MNLKIFNRKMVDLIKSFQTIQNILKFGGEEAGWSKRYPILKTYRSMPGTEEYLDRISALCGRVKAEFGLSELDTFLVVEI